eukprot:comp11532_c0_seq1/m.5986 comp11532_c0_seq1/g.5986  ORF comp11532_c0_seq1/g.5986 comp11532_c0_seq1/m.5986 type:complete len:400 (-) comp11532_c0_seq1:354-1553(-)
MAASAKCSYAMDLQGPSPSTLRPAYDYFDMTDQIVTFNCSGRTLVALRAALQSAAGSVIGSMFSGRWQTTNAALAEGGHVVVDYDPVHFAEILRFLHLKWLRHAELNDRQKALVLGLLRQAWCEEDTITEQGLLAPSLTQPHNMWAVDLSDTAVKEAITFLSKARAPKCDADVEDLVDYLSLWEYMYADELPFSFVETADGGVCISNHGRTVTRVSVLARDGYTISGPAISAKKTVWRMRVTRLASGYRLFFGVMATSTSLCDSITRMEGSYGWVNKRMANSARNPPTQQRRASGMGGGRSWVEAEAQEQGPQLWQGDEVVMCLDRENGQLAMKVIQNTRNTPTRFPTMMTGHMERPPMPDVFRVRVARNEEYMVQVVLYGNGDTIDLLPAEDGDELMF